MSLPLLLTVGISSLCVYKLIRGLQFVNYTPGPRPLFSPINVFGAILPSGPLNPGFTWSWNDRKTAYYGKTRDVIAFVPWVVGGPIYYTNSLDIMKQLLGAENKLHLEKPIDLTLAQIWGDSVPSSSGEIWRRHRRAVSPAFNQQTYQEVWVMVQSLYREMAGHEGWQDMSELKIDDVNPLILKFTLTVISRCGFGFDAPWSRIQGEENGPFDALRKVSQTIIPRLVIPGWAYSLPFESIETMKTAWDTVMHFILDTIAQSRTVKENGAGDGTDIAEDAHINILNTLISSLDAEDKRGLSEKEVISNMFSLVFAGHETTASALSSTLAYMSLYPEEQEKAFLEITNAFPDGLTSDALDSSKLTFTLYCFWEAQRLVPAATFAPRRLHSEAVINVQRPATETMHLKSGSVILFDLIGISQNPHIFSDPEVFRPGRWEQFTEFDVGTFGFGPRACIGRKLAQTEALAFLSMLLRDWRVETNLVPGESREAYQRRVVDNAGLSGTAFALKRVPLKLVRRNRSG